MTFALIGFIAAVNPAAAAMLLSRTESTSRPVAVALAVVASVGAVAALAAAADPVLDALDVSLGTYRVGAGAVVAAAGLRWLLSPPAGTVTEPVTAAGMASFVAFPTLLTPGLAALAVSVGAEHGTATAALAAAVALGVGGVLVHNRLRLHSGMLAGAVRFVGGLGVIAGVVVVIDGLRTL